MSRDHFALEDNKDDNWQHQNDDSNNYPCHIGCERTIIAEMIPLHTHAGYSVNFEIVLEIDKTV